jgi:hypothetical protein
MNPFFYYFLVLVQIFRQRENVADPPRYVKPGSSDSTLRVCGVGVDAFVGAAAAIRILTPREGEAPPNPL